MCSRTRVSISFLDAFWIENLFFDQMYNIRSKSINSCNVRVCWSKSAHAVVFAAVDLKLQFHSVQSTSVIMFNPCSTSTLADFSVQQLIYSAATRKFPRAKLSYHFSPHYDLVLIWSSNEWMNEGFDLEDQLKLKRLCFGMLPLMYIVVETGACFGGWDIFWGCAKCIQKKL